MRELKYRMMITDLLKVASESYTYQELSEHLGLSPPILSRYMRGHVLPSYSRAQGLYDRLMEITNIKDELKKRINFDEEGYFDNTPLVSEITWLKILANYAMEKFAGRRVTKVLTAAVDGIPVSTLVSNLLDVDLIVAKDTKEVGINDFIEETYIPKGSAIRKSLYVPKGSIKKRDSVLIIDDVVRTGETVKALVNVVRNQRADVSGVYVIVAVGDVWKRYLKDIISRYSFEVLIET
ncbi:MAG: phosphoribosyltransferase family protein [Candidatus Bathyarchaeia archaeon]